MTATLSLRWRPQRLPIFDGVVARFEASLMSFSEAEALKPEFWDAGEDARLREDERFRPTLWRRWTLAHRALINDALFARMQTAPDEGLLVADAVAPSGQTHVFCAGDPRFVLSNGIIRLAGQRDLTSAEGREKITRRLREARPARFRGRTIAGFDQAPGRLDELAGLLRLPGGGSGRAAPGGRAAGGGCRRSSRSWPSPPGRKPGKCWRPTSATVAGASAWPAWWTNELPRWRGLAPSST
jgi:hypothetical protein